MNLGALGVLVVFICLAPDPPKTLPLPEAEFFVKIG